MNRLRTPAAVMLLAVILLSQTACPKAKRSELAGWTSEAVVTAKEILPLFPAGSNTATITEFVNIGDKLAKAFKDNATADAIPLTSAMIVQLRLIVAETQRIQDPAKRTLILATLTAANIVLHRIADRLAEEAAIAPVQAGVARSIEPTATKTIEQFRVRQHWRCRNAVTGRFAAMSFCKTNPAQSVVEAY